MFCTYLYYESSIDTSRDYPTLAPAKLDAAFDRSDTPKVNQGQDLHPYWVPPGS